MNISFLKKISAGVLAMFCLMSGTSGSAQAVADIKTYRLENGLTVLVKEDSRFPLVAVRLFVKAGSAWEKPEEAGMSHLLEHMVFKGSKTSGPGVDKTVENAGGSMNAYTSYDMTTYLTDLPASRWKEAMTAVRDLAFDPLLLQADLDAEREVVLAEKKQRGDSPMTKLFQTAMAHTLKGTPYETPVIGTEKALRGMTPEMMRAYIKRRYDPRDMVLSVAGDVKADEVLAEARRLFGEYRNNNVLAVEPVIAPASLAHGLVVDVQEGPWNKAFVSLSFPMADQNDALSPAADVLSHLLSGDETSLLPRKLRIETALVDAVDASAMTFERVGVFMLLAQVDAAKTGEYLRTISSMLAGLKAEDFSDAQIARAKLNIEDSYFRGLENISDIAETMGAEYFYDPGSVGGERWLSAVRGVDRAQIQRVIDQWLKPDALTVAALIPQGKEGAAAVLNEDSARAAIVAGWPEAGKSVSREAETSADKGSLKPEVLQLGEGRTLVLLPDRSLPYVSATLAFSGGELLVPDDKEGLASLTASVLTDGTSMRSLHDINVYLSERASGLSASASTRQFSLRMDAPARFAPEVFTLMKEVLDSPAFREEDVERAKREQIASIVSREESATGLLGRHLRHSLFGKGAYAHRGAGTAETVKTFGREDVAGFWKQQSERPWVLSVAGDYDRAEVERFAASLAAPDAARAESNAPVWSDQRSFELKLPGRDQAVYLMLFPTVGTDDEDRAALRLLSECLSGFTGKLYQELREKQSLGYSVFPMDWSAKETGFLGFGIVASPQNLDKARTSFEAIVRDLQKDTLPEETIARAKAVAEADYYKSRQSRAARASEGASLILQKRSLDYAMKRLEELKSVDAEQLRAVARKYLDLNKAYEFRVTP
ncbi:MAG: insulinase family protein [Mailhella sp.]|nr:insulinase family protein [Mailhella sp.]